ncbi:MerR family transcriptional regulator [Microbispora sp. RL4-1S]|uniref:MerR family transcriptional regulator n=1 Tax=Microbispora oryzae TaxID=2806554 RepID=A0A941AKL6_9ACTN|nr:MerR family transcriptional regulator [Microbispora oryzae]MBP2705388.1 MerR family transcriptional regulator [Microbispora oryzae]
MLMSQLRAESGVPIATIKYYLREGLLPPGEQTSATRAEYNASHVRRLRLIRALVDVGRLPLATIRKIIEAVEDEQTSVHQMLGAAHYALSLPVEPAPDDPDWQEAGALVDEMITEMGWVIYPDAPTRAELAQTLVSLKRLGMPATRDDLLPYARVADELAREHDLRKVRLDGPRDTAVETLVIMQVLYGRALDALRRLAQEAESARIAGKVQAATGPPPEGD